MRIYHLYHYLLFKGIITDHRLAWYQLCIYYELLCLVV